MTLFMQYLGNYQFPPLFVVVVFVWSLIWKGLALWRAAEYKQLYWFIALMVLNTVGILEIIYLFYFAKKKLTIEELKSWYKEKFNR